MIWITALLGALTIVLESRWAHSPNWVSIRFPRILYVDAAILVRSSLSIEVARRSLQRGRGRRCIRGILVSLWMGFAFLVGQTFAWHELSLRGLHFNANPGSLFLYLVTGAHGLFVLGGMGLLSYVGFLIRRDTRTKWRAAMDSIALYWHFTDALWLYLVVLLFATIQDSSSSQGVVFPCLAAVPSCNTLLVIVSRSKSRRWSTNLRFGDKQRRSEGLIRANRR
jgi:cytochrome c oxidase subunit 3